jgi:hypothetical protein
MRPTRGETDQSCKTRFSLLPSRENPRSAYLAADNPGSFIDATPTAKLMRQVWLGAISEFNT